MGFSKQHTAPSSRFQMSPIFTLSSVRLAENAWLTTPDSSSNGAAKSYMSSHSFQGWHIVFVRYLSVILKILRDITWVQQMDRQSPFGDWSIALISYHARELTMIPSSAVELMPILIREKSLGNPNKTKPTYNHTVFAMLKFWKWPQKESVFFTTAPQILMFFLGPKHPKTRYHFTSHRPLCAWGIDLSEPGTVGPIDWNYCHGIDWGSICGTLAMPLED